MPALSGNLFKSRTRFVIVWRALNFFTSGETGLSAMQCLSLDVVEAFLDKALAIYLGKDRTGDEYVCLDISEYDEDALTSLSQFGQFGDLREAAPSIPGDDGSVLAYAKAMCHWHSRLLLQYMRQSGQFRTGRPYKDMRQHRLRCNAFPAH